MPKRPCLSFPSMRVHGKAVRPCAACGEAKAAAEFKTAASKWCLACQARGRDGQRKLRQMRALKAQQTQMRTCCLGAGPHACTLARVQSCQSHCVCAPSLGPRQPSQAAGPAPKKQKTGTKRLVPAATGGGPAASPPGGREASGGMEMPAGLAAVGPPA